MMREFFAFIFLSVLWVSDFGRGKCEIEGIWTYGGKREGKR